MTDNTRWCLFKKYPSFETFYTFIIQHSRWVCKVASSGAGLPTVTWQSSTWFREQIIKWLWGAKQYGYLWLSDNGLDPKLSIMNCSESKINGSILPQRITLISHLIGKTLMVPRSTHTAAKWPKTNLLLKLWLCSLILAVSATTQCNFNNCIVQISDLNNNLDSNYLPNSAFHNTKVSKCFMKQTWRDIQTVVSIKKCKNVIHGHVQ